jgi:hypothetical protein
MYYYKPILIKPVVTAASTPRSSTKRQWQQGTSTGTNKQSNTASPPSSLNTNEKAVSTMRKFEPILKLLLP